MGIAEYNSEHSDLVVGEELRRTEVHDKYGGSRQGGIASAPKTGNVLLFTSAAGPQYGYDYDGWSEDGAFHYTGEGQDGDQRFVRGNKAVNQQHKTLRLFEETRSRFVRYLGKFHLDAEQPHYFADAPGLSGEIRRVIVFRLRPIDGAAPSETPNDSLRPMARLMPFKKRLDEKDAWCNATNQPREKSRETALVWRYAQWLEQQGHEVDSREIRLAGQAGALYVDLVDNSSDEIVVTNISGARTHIHMALGKVLDYARFLEHQRLAVLVPVRPTDDLLDLLLKHGVSCIFETQENHFEHVTA